MVSICFKSRKSLSCGIPHKTHTGYNLSRDLQYGARIHRWMGIFDV